MFICIRAFSRQVGEEEFMSPKLPLAFYIPNTLPLTLSPNCTLIR